MRISSKEELWEFVYAKFAIGKIHTSAISTIGMPTAGNVSYLEAEKHNTDRTQSLRKFAVNL